MTVLSADAVRRIRGIGTAVRRKYPILTAVEIFKGSLVSIDAAGFAIPSADTASTKCVGIAAEHVNNAGASGALSIEVVSNVDVLLPATSITQAMVGDLMLVEDSGEMDDAAGPTNDIPIGRLSEYVSATSGWVGIPNLGGATA